MTPYASFEPILVVTTLHCSSVCILELIYAIKFLLVAKKYEEKENTHQVLQTTCPASSGPIFIAATLCHSPYCVFCR